MKRKSISYAKWGYLFLIPFFVVYAIFSFVPLAETFGYSFLDYKIASSHVDSIRPTSEESSTEINDGFCGLKNYGDVLKQDGMFSKSFANTVILWLIGFIPQIIFSLLLASWYTDIRLKLKAQGFFKTVMYLPNVIMASALSLLFFALLAKDTGALDNLLGNPDLLNKTYGLRGTVGFINFLMWYGNTTILLMAAMMGIDTSLYEAAQIDGANPSQTFWQITMPLIKPILAYVLVTSMIGGLQMYDVPYLIDKNGGRKDVLLTLVCQIQKGKRGQIGQTSAMSMLIFVVSAILGFITLKVMDDKSVKSMYDKKKQPKKFNMASSKK